MLMVSEEKLRKKLYEILHGDEKHQAWLKEKIEETIIFCKKVENTS